MLDYDSKWLFRRLSVLFPAICCLISAGAFAQQTPVYNMPPPPPPANSNQSASQPGSNPALVAQPLVPESFFAIQLIEALSLEPTQDQSKAEALLSKLGIEPKNGWISEYPVTPAILGEVDKGIVNASDQGKISLGKDQALKRVADLKTRLGFQINSDPNKIPAAGQRQSQNMNISTIYSYVDSKGGKHFTDVYDSIPPEYRAKAKILSQSATPSAASGISPFTPDQQYAPVPDPGFLNGYYQNQGPPAVTYFTPPASYYYLYSWVPYPFWSTGYYFPGFFVLNDFHRQIAFNNNTFSVSHHAGPHSSASTGFISNGPTANGLFTTPNAQNGARAIVTQQQNRTLDRAEELHAQAAGRPPTSGLAGGEARAGFNQRAMQQGIVQSVPNQINPIRSFQPSFVPEAPVFHYAPMESREFHAEGREHGTNAGGGGRGGGRR